MARFLLCYTYRHIYVYLTHLTNFNTVKLS
nr:MAG TPA: hypothetical protein [Caudoviricetes sp.]